MEVLPLLIGGCGLVNLGDDADTVGAIYGQLAGAYYGGIPRHWTNLCTFRPLITMFAQELLALSEVVDISSINPQATVDSG